MRPVTQWLCALRRDRLRREKLARNAVLAYVASINKFYVQGGPSAERPRPVGARRAVQALGQRVICPTRD